MEEHLGRDAQRLSVEDDHDRPEQGERRSASKREELRIQALHHGTTSAWVWVTWPSINGTKYLDLAILL